MLTDRHSETEMLDVAPVDLLHGLSKDFSKDLDENVLSPELKSQALDMQFHWVNETGKMAKLTGGINLQPTVGTRFSHDGYPFRSFMLI